MARDSRRSSDADTGNPGIGGSHPDGTVEPADSVTVEPADSVDLHEWLSFEDPTEQRTWVFDATFLRSNWSCIFGCGCKGVLDADATDLQQGCCSYGAHFIDDADVQTVVESAARLTAQQWQFRNHGRRGGMFVTTDPVADADVDAGQPVVTTRLVDDACIFLNRPGFEGGVGCALHIGALAAGERPLDWKPDVCWQLPLRLVEATDDEGYVTSTLREWKRRDWGAGGQDFEWWCTESPEAFIGVHPAYRYLRDEIIELVGEPVYLQLVVHLERPTWTPLPHPAVRR